MATTEGSALAQAVSPISCPRGVTHGEQEGTDGCGCGMFRMTGGTVVDESAATGEETTGMEWGRRSDVRRVFGVGKDILDAWVDEDKVEAHKLNPGRNGTVIFSIADVKRAILSSPRYLPSKDAADRSRV